MAKKFAFIIALIMVISCLFVLTSCKVEDYDIFTPLEHNPSADDPVASNGGIAVEKGNYIYFVNGWATYTSDNIFGSVLEGSIMRILKSDMESVVAATSQKDAFDEMQEKAVVVVPKIFSQGNTADKSVTGFYIFGDRIYYFTPNADIDKNASPKSSEMCLNSCNLDGTNTYIHHIFTDRATVTFLSNAEEKVYCTYLSDGVLYNITLKGNKDKEQKILEKCGGVLYDESGVVFVLNSDSTVIYKYNPGQEEAKEILNGKKNSEGETKSILDKESYALINVYNGECFIKITGTTNSALNSICKIKSDESLVKITNHIPTSLKGAGDYLIVIKSDNSIAIVDLAKPNLEDKTVVKTKTYSAAPTLLYIKDNTLYFTESSKLYSLDISQTLEGEEELSTTLLASTSQYSSSGMQYDVCANFVFLFGSTQNTDNKVYPLYISALDTDEEGKTIEYNITRLTKRSYYITIDEENILNGTLSVKVGSSTVTNTIAGNTVTVTVSPKTGYKLKEGSLKYGDTPLTVSSTNTYTFVMPQEHVTLTAEFELVDYTITLPDIENATITVKDKITEEIITTAKMGQEIIVTITLQDGYRIKEGTFKYNSTVRTPNDGVVEITMPASNIVIDVEIEIESGD